MHEAVDTKERLKCEAKNDKNCQSESSRELGKVLCLICFLCWRKLSTVLIPFH